MRRIHAHDDNCVHIGTDADEIWRGWIAMDAASREQFSALEYCKAELSNLTVGVSRNCEVAWSGCSYRHTTRCPQTESFKLFEMK